MQIFSDLWECGLHLMIVTTPLNTRQHPKAPKGKVRLVYECNPIVYIIKQTGGRASNGYSRILDIDTTGLHQRSAIFIGSENMVKSRRNDGILFAPVTIDL